MEHEETLSISMVSLLPTNSRIRNIFNQYFASASVGYLIIIIIIIYYKIVHEVHDRQICSAWRGGSMVGRRLRDRKVAGSTPGLCAIT